jgi:anaerobic ribonucleoside-triphosphate reductase activating protein
MKIRLAGPLVVDSIVDGVGLRTTIFVQGCRRHCFGCHNQKTWAMDGGSEYEVAEIKKQLGEVKGQDGITLSGGEPFLQAAPLGEIARYARGLGLSVWAFSGFLVEELQQGTKSQRELLRLVDVLVDGPFILAERSLDLGFKGSRNQRILKLKNGVVVREIG